MKTNQPWQKKITTLVLLLMLEISTSAHAGLFGFGDDKWKEEALLHDGSTMIVSRSQSYGGGHEIGQSPPMNKASISFTLPGTHRTISWNETLYPNDPNSENLILLAVDIVDGTPFLITSPVGRMTTNKWGCLYDQRYVVLKYDGKAWNQIPMSELPLEITKSNVIISTQGQMLGSHSGVVTAKEIRALNSGGGSGSPEFLTTFERKPPDQPQPPCVKLINYKGEWIRPNDDLARKMIDSVKK